MSVNDEIICRLCLKLTKNEFEAVDSVVLDILLLKINLNVSDDPVICRDCSEVAKQSLHFKYLCIETERHILSFASGKYVIQFDMNDIFLQDVHTIGVEKYAGICRFCLNHVEENDFVTVESLMKEETFMNMSLLLMPEIDLSVIRNPLICTACKEGLINYFKFVEKSVNTEKNIRSYCKYQMSRDPSNITLSEVVNHNSSSVSSNYLCTGGFSEGRADITETKALNLAEPGKNSEETIHASIMKSFCATPLEIILRKYPQKMTLKSVLKRRLLAHKQLPTKFFCGFCTFQTNYKYSLVNHMKLHRKANADGKTFKCTVCSYESKHRKLLTEHMWRHSTEKRIYRCQRCSHQTNSKYKQYKHSQSHKGIAKISVAPPDKPQRPQLVFKCSLCTYETKEERCLKNHSLVHKRVPLIKHIATCQCETCIKSKLKLRFKTLLRS